MSHPEQHRTQHIGWLRASVLGANDGLISTSSLVVGVAAAQTARDPVLLAALAGLVAGALSMAEGEYVSVSSQADTERADLSRERRELATTPDLERAELAEALASAAAFAAGAALPVLFTLFLPFAILAPAVVGGSLAVLLVLGGVAARLGGAPRVRGAVRVAFWGAVAMGATALVGRLFGTVAL